MATEADLSPRPEGFDRFARGDIDGMLELAVEEGFETHAPETLPNGGTYHGRDGCLALGRRAGSRPGRTFRIEIVGVEAIGERHVVTTTDQHAVGRGSGVPVDQTAYHLNEVADGKIRCVHFYLTREEALAAVAARERATPPGGGRERAS